MKILIFAGTKNGRELAEMLADRNHEVIVSSASAYGSAQIKTHPNITTYHGRLDYNALIKFAKAIEVDVVIDSTHPYAVEVSKNVIRLCNEFGYKLIRFERPSTINKEEGYHFKNMSAVCKYLQSQDGNILFFTTGVNEVPSIVKDISTDRIHVRVIPVDRSMEIIKTCGLLTDNVVVKKSHLFITMTM